ncbi:MAG: pyridoxamine 5'-phosphate oxidase family protein, partial [Tissierellales bacterium]
MNVKMTAEELKQKIWEFLKEHKEGALATCLNNVPRSSPVQYVVGDDLTVYILSAGGEKFKAISQNPNVCLLVNTNYINYRQIKGVQIFGKATT